MAFYWTLNAIPEIQDLPRPQQQRLWRRASRQAMRRLPFWGAVVGSLILTGPLATAATRWGMTSAAIPQNILTFGIFVGVVLLVMNQIITRVLGLAVLGWIIAMGVEYWLLRANAILGQSLDFGVMVGLGGILMSQLVTLVIRPHLARERAALFPQPQHDDGSYWVPPAV